MCDKNFERHYSDTGHARKFRGKQQISWVFSWKQHLEWTTKYAWKSHWHDLWFWSPLRLHRRILLCIWRLRVSSKYTKIQICLSLSAKFLENKEIKDFNFSILYKTRIWGYAELIKRCSPCTTGTYLSFCIRNIHFRRTFPNIRRDAYVYSFKDQEWRFFPNAFDVQDMLLGSATLQELDSFFNVISFDGVVPSLSQNLSFDGNKYVFFSGLPLRAGSQFAKYSFPPATEPEELRNFPAALWANADNVCQPAI